MTKALPSHPTGWRGVGTDIYEITPSDNTDLAQPVRSLKIVGDGNVEIICPDTPPETSRIVPVTDGELLQVAVTRVKAAGTTVDAVWGIV